MMARTMRTADFQRKHRSKVPREFFPIPSKLPLKSKQIHKEKTESKKFQPIEVKINLKNESSFKYNNDNKTSQVGHLNVSLRQRDKQTLKHEDITTIRTSRPKLLIKEAKMPARIKAQQKIISKDNAKGVQTSKKPSNKYQRLKNELSDHPRHNRRKSLSRTKSVAKSKNSNKNSSSKNKQKPLTVKKNNQRVSKSVIQAEDKFGKSNSHKAKQAKLKNDKKEKGKKNDLDTSLLKRNFEMQQVEDDYQNVKLRQSSSISEIGVLKGAGSKLQKMKKVQTAKVPGPGIRQITLSKLFLLSFQKGDDSWTFKLMNRRKQSFKTAVSTKCYCTCLNKQRELVCKHLKYILNTIAKCPHTIEELEKHGIIPETSYFRLNTCLKIVLDSRMSLRGRGYNSTRSETLCYICMQEMTLQHNHQVTQFHNCKHTYHKSCIYFWRSLSKQSCPICQNEMGNTLPVEQPYKIDEKIET